MNNADFDEMKNATWYYLNAMKFFGCERKS